MSRWWRGAEGPPDAGAGDAGAARIGAVAMLSMWMQYSRQSPGSAGTDIIPRRRNGVARDEARPGRGPGSQFGGRVLRAAASVLAQRPGRIDCRRPARGQSRREQGRGREYGRRPE